MEFFDGCIFEDFVIFNVFFDYCCVIWVDVVCILVKFYCIDLKSVGLESFGCYDGFYNWQIVIWKQICGVQVVVEDVDIKE